MFKTIPSLVVTSFLMLTAFSSLHADTSLSSVSSGETVLLSGNTLSNISLGQELYTFCGESGNTLTIYLNDINTINNDLGVTIEMVIGYEFEDATIAFTKLTITPDHDLINDDNMEYVQSLIAARPDLLPLLEGMFNNSVPNFNNGLPGDNYVMGFSNWKCWGAMAGVVISATVPPVQLIDVAWGGLSVAGVLHYCFGMFENAAPVV